MSVHRAFHGSHLTWPYERNSQRFRVRVVEPDDVWSMNNDRVLFAVLQELLNPTMREVDRFDRDRRPVSADRYDLITFPEAFATPQAVLAVADSLAGQGPSGCVHVGLKSGITTSTHLMRVAEISELVAELEVLLGANRGDLTDFKNWLSRQSENHNFNIGCVLAVDANGDLRICLHPKIVASRFEIDALPELNMKEADLLTLITLRPTGGGFSTVTLQPLICSDALNIPTERMTGPPIMAVTQHGECFQAVPDHVDVVSVATCTPQPRGFTPDGPYAQWHRQFLDALLAVAENPGCRRHNFASVVLSNYRKIGRDEAGLSGAFVPRRSGFTSLHAEITVSAFGRPGDGSWANNGWSIPSADLAKDFEHRGFLMSLDFAEPSKSTVARVLGFALHHLPREAFTWGSTVTSVVEPGVVRYVRGDDNSVEPMRTEFANG